MALIGVEFARGDPNGDYAWQLAEAFARRGSALDWYAGGPDGGLSERLALPGVRLITFDTGWRPDRWYSRHAVSRAFTHHLCRRHEHRRLAALLLEQHSFRAYDVVYQFAAPGNSAITRQVAGVIPMIDNPETHSADELVYSWLHETAAVARELIASVGPRPTEVGALLLAEHSNADFSTDADMSASIPAGRGGPTGDGT